jgi:BASS family bile acid:Na+ symporter
MNELLPRLLGITLVIFMAGNLLETGLKVNLALVGKALRDGRFIGLSLLWSFVLCPLLALFITKILPLAEPYALGLLFLGMAPCAPFLPMVTEKAKGDLAYAAAFMLLTAVGTVIYMPFAVPLLAKGFDADTWTIAKPLVFFIATPLAIGIAIRLAAEAFAEKAHPIVKKITGIDTLLMLLLVLIIYWKDFLSAVGTFAIGAQILFYAIVTVASYGLAFKVAPARRSVLALGLATRNIGAALAPLMAVAGTDQRAIAMCALGVPITVIWAMLAAKRLARLGEAVATQ